MSRQINQEPAGGKTAAGGGLCAVARLKRDHQLLRAKLTVLESALAMGEEAWFVLRELCHSLAGQLRDHIRREEALLAVSRVQIDDSLLARVALEHQDEPEHLRAVNRLFVHEPKRSFRTMRLTLEAVIRGLREHMEEEEAQLFPAIEGLLVGSEPIAWARPQEGTMLHEAMTVNRVVLEHPRTLPVFKRLFVSVPFEGCDCLDEVAWRHGMESRELLGLLEEAIAGEVLPDDSPVSADPCRG